MHTFFHDQVRNDPNHHVSFLFFLRFNFFLFLKNIRELYQRTKDIIYICAYQKYLKFSWLGMLQGITIKRGLYEYIYPVIFNSWHEELWNLSGISVLCKRNRNLLPIKKKQGKSPPQRQHKNSIHSTNQKGLEHLPCYRETNQ